jgi:hypothetical protein
MADDVFGHSWEEGEEEARDRKELWREREMKERLLWKKQLTLLLLDLRRISTLNGVGHSPANISDAGIASHYRLY